MGLIRVLLALGVLLEHSNHDVMMSSYTAVQTFFMISGFYMSMIMTSRRYSLQGFYLSRFFRIFPVYWAAISIGFLSLISAYYLGITTTLFTSIPKQEYEWYEYIWLFWVNLFVWGSDSVWFLSSIVGNGTSHLTSSLVIPPIWTVSLEITFYMLVPFLFKFRTRTLLLLISLSLFFRIVSYLLGLNDNPFHARFFPFELTLFIMGILSHRLLSFWKSNQIVGIFFFITTLFFIVFFKDISNWMNWIMIYNRPDYLASWIFYIFFMVALPYIFELTKKSKLDNYFGEYSYPFYLVHYIFVVIFIHSSSSDYKTVLGLSIVISAVLVHFVQIPIDRYRHNKYTQLPSSQS